MKNLHPGPSAEEITRFLRWTRPAGDDQDADRCLRKFPMTSRSAVCALALSATTLTAGAVFLPSAAQAVIIWDWSFSTNGGFGGSGTITTDGDTPEADVSYNIIEATGTVANVSITGVKQNPVRWTGSASNKLQVLGPIGNDNGLAFNLADGGGAVVDFTTSGWGLPDFSSAIGPGGVYFFEGAITSQSFTPQAGPGPNPNPVPGPLPLMGAAAAFGWTRRLRRRIPTRTHRF